jgi:hypothetical protein
MIVRVLNSVAFYMLLEEMDKYIAQPHWCAPCPVCGGGLRYVTDDRFPAEPAYWASDDTRKAYRHRQWARPWGPRRKEQIDAER